MKRFLLLFLLIPSLVYGAAGDVASIDGKAITAIATVAGKANAAILTIAGKPCSDGDSVAYCAGTELFCSTFESATTWDATNSVTSDCDGYDADGDYCDGDTTTYVIGAKSLGVRGTTTNYVQENLSSADQTELYLEGWFSWSDIAAGGASIGLRSTTTGQVAFYHDTDSTLLVKVNADTVSLDTATTISADTWYHIGVYYKEETGSNDGIVRAWINTSTSEGFVASDLKINNTTVDTGTQPLDLVRFRGGGAGNTAYYDNIRIKGGSPSWPTE